MKIVYVYVICEFPVMGGVWLGEGGGNYGNDKFFGCAKLYQNSDVSIIFRVSINSGGATVAGFLYCITAS